MAGSTLTVDEMQTISGRLRTLRSMPLVKDAPELLQLVGNMADARVDVTDLKSSGITAEVNHVFMRRHPDSGVRLAVDNLIAVWKAKAGASQLLPLQSPASPEELLSPDVLPGSPPSQSVVPVPVCTPSVISTTGGVPSASSASSASTMAHHGSIAGAAEVTPVPRARNPAPLQSANCSPADFFARLRAVPAVDPRRKSKSHSSGKSKTSRDKHDDAKRHATSEVRRSRSDKHVVQSPEKSHSKTMAKSKDAERSRKSSISSSKAKAILDPGLRRA